MTDALYDFDIEPTLASAVKAGRAWTGQTMRRLAVTSGISAGQISRIEAGHVSRPSIDTLLALSPALNHHPTPMLVLGGQLVGEPARSALHDLLTKMLEGCSDSDERDGLEGLRSRVAADSETLRAVAIEALTYGSRAVLWPETLNRAVPASAPDHDVLARIVAAWPSISPDRRWRLAELADDFSAVSRLELGARA